MEFYVTSTLPKLYKRDSRGVIRVWWAEVGEHDGVGAHRVIAGVHTGKLVTSEWNVSEGKNLGKKNATDSVTQAHAEATSLWQKKVELEYFDDINAVDDERFTSPMLAQDYKKRADKIDWSGVVYSQPKLDGIRCIARKDGLWTRKGKRIVAIPHIEAALYPFFEQNPQAILDGELYNHDLRDDFNKITSIVRKAKPTKTDIIRAREGIQYHVYDCVSDKPFKERTAAVADAVKFVNDESVVQVVTRQAGSVEKLDALYSEWLEGGYEGQMVRIDGVPYMTNRSASLLKRKEFLTDEFRVLRVEEGQGNWSGAVKRFALVTADGKEFGAGVRGKYEEMEELLQKGFTPLWATVRYFTPTPDGIPRFPVVIDYGFDDSRQD